MAWVRQPDGKWVDDSAPAPVRAPIPDAPAARLGRLDEVTGEFNENPYAFMLKYPVSPPDVAPGADIGPEIRRSALADGIVLAGAASANPSVVLAEGGGKRFVRIANHNAPNFPGAKTLQFVENGLTDGTSIPIEWLPWRSLSIIRHTIPPVPNNLYNPLELDYPRIFFTAGINGCSVFVQGTAENPTISHAGITGSLSRAATEFWQEQMGILSPGRIRGETSTRDYIKGDAITAQAEQYVKWLNSTSAVPAKLTLTSPFGSVFGVRHGRAWTFYLQKNALVMEYLLYKESEVKKDGRGYKVKATNQEAVFHETRRENQHVFGKKTPWQINKKTFRSPARYVTKTMLVGEIFPRRLISTDLQDQWRLAVH